MCDAIGVRSVQRNMARRIPSRIEPLAVAARLIRAMEVALASTDAQKDAQVHGCRIRTGMTGPTFVALVEKDSGRWAGLIGRADVKVE